MPTASPSAARARASHAPATKINEPKGKEQDAIAMLMADHKKVKGLFEQFKKLKEDGEDDEKAALVEQICFELTVHAELEEEIFYPAVREQIGDEDLMDEAEVEHAGAKDLIAQLESMEPGDDLYDAKVTVLGEQVDHHVKEEEGEMFPKVRKAKVDTAALGAEMASRKEELAPPDDEAPAKVAAPKRKR
jgi:hemerythrin superfamily protein